MALYGHPVRITFRSNLIHSGLLLCSAKFIKRVFLLFRVWNHLTFMNLDPDFLLTKVGAMLLLKIWIYSVVFVEAQTKKSLIAY